MAERESQRSISRIGSPRIRLKQSLGWVRAVVREGRDGAERKLETAADREGRDVGPMLIRDGSWIDRGGTWAQCEFGREADRAGRDVGRPGRF